MRAFELKRRIKVKETRRNYMVIHFIPTYYILIQKTQVISAKFNKHTWHFEQDVYTLNLEFMGIPIGFVGISVAPY